MTHTQLWVTKIKIILLSYFDKNIVMLFECCTMFDDMKFKDVSVE